MRIVYAGNFQPGVTDPWSTECDYRMAFEELGHTVTSVQENDPDALHQIAHAVNDGDVAMVLNTRTWPLEPYDDAVAVWRECERRGVVTAAVHLDRWWGLSREPEVDSQAMFAMAHVFTADGDAHDWFLERGVNHHWLPPAVRGSEAHDSEPYPPWQPLWDVAFVGSAPTPAGGHYHDEEWPHRRELVAWLRARFGDRFVHIGNGGDVIVDDSMNERTTLRGHWLNRLLRSAPLVVGDSCLVRREGRYWSDRVPEVWGRGGFLIHPGVHALNEAFGESLPGNGWDPYDWDALSREIDRWLAAPEERETTRQRLQEEVRRHHTYRQRAQTILETVGLA